MRGRLEAEQAEVRERLRRLTDAFGGVVAASRDTNADDEHDPEGATIAFERAQVSGLVRQAKAHLDEIDAALHRWDDGTYGVCEHCGQPIDPARLEVRPAARRCIRCPAR
jgi:RNA polymerase-binding transcription factor DksA